MVRWETILQRLRADPVPGGVTFSVRRAYHADNRPGTAGRSALSGRIFGNLRRQRRRRGNLL